jgi:hypothetical protein
MSAIPNTKMFCLDQFCAEHDKDVLAKSADIWLSGRHVADMSATLPAKLSITIIACPTSEMIAKTEFIAVDGSP